MPGKCARGMVLEIELGPKVGDETTKARPCVVVQNDIGNKNSSLTIVAPITKAEGLRLYPVVVFVAKGNGGLPMDSVVLCNHLHTVVEDRFGKVYGQLDAQTMSRIDAALKISLALEQK